jgi:hypothetical protein
MPRLAVFCKNCPNRCIVVHVWGECGRGGKGGGAHTQALCSNTRLVRYQQRVVVVVRGSSYDASLHLSLTTRTTHHPPYFSPPLSARLILLLIVALSLAFTTTAVPPLLPPTRESLVLKGIPPHHHTAVRPTPTPLQSLLVSPAALLVLLPAPARALLVRLGLLGLSPSRPPARGRARRRGCRRRRRRRRPPRARGRGPPPPRPPRRRGGGAGGGGRGRRASGELS